jgi:hypothetical protein
MYELHIDIVFGRYLSVSRVADGASIPFDPANRDCAQFLADWEGGAEVLDAAGAPFPYTPENLATLGLGPPVPAPVQLDQAPAIAASSTRAGQGATSSTSSASGKKKPPAIAARSTRAPAKKAPAKKPKGRRK